MHDAATTRPGRMTTAPSCNGELGKKIPSMSSGVGTASIKMPNNVESGENAYRILAVDLDDEAVMWDLAKFRQMERNTSWFHRPVGSQPEAPVSKSSR